MNAAVLAAIAAVATVPRGQGLSVLLWSLGTLALLAAVAAVALNRWAKRNLPEPLGAGSVDVFGNPWTPE